MIRVLFFRARQWEAWDWILEPALQRLELVVVTASTAPLIPATLRLTSVVQVANICRMMVHVTIHAIRVITARTAQVPTPDARAEPISLNPQL